MAMAAVDTYFSKYVDKYEKMIKRQLENEVDAEEYIEGVLKNVKSQIVNLYLESDMTVREFSLFAEVSRSTLERIIYGKKSAVDVKISTLCKFALSCGYPLACIVTDITKEDINLLTLYKRLPEQNKKDIKQYIENVNIGRINKNSLIVCSDVNFQDVKFRKSRKMDRKIIPGQMSLFD